MINLKVFKFRWFLGPFESYRRRRNPLLYECAEKYASQVEKVDWRTGYIYFKTDATDIPSEYQFWYPEQSPCFDVNENRISQCEYYDCTVYSVDDGVYEGWILCIDNVSKWLLEW